MLLEIRNLTVGYGTKAIQSDLDISAPAGALISLVGTNGAGKSTLLRTLAGLQRPLAGTVRIAGHDINTITPHERARHMSIVLTDRIDIERLTIRHLVAMGRFPYTNWLGSLSDSDNLIIDRAIADVNLSHKADADINHVSDGEKQRAIIAKALAQDTPLVLLDEPTAHLDLPNRIETMLLLRRLSVSTKKTFILSTHELDLALQTSDQIWLMTPRGVQIGMPEDLMLSGSFQSAFGSDNYSFDAIDGHCIVRHRTGTLRVAILSDPGSDAYTAWLRRALMRIGIIASPDADITIRCTTAGYRLTTPRTGTLPTLYAKISDLLSELNQINL